MLFGIWKKDTLEEKWQSLSNITINDESLIFREEGRKPIESVAWQKDVDRENTDLAKIR